MSERVEAEVEISDEEIRQKLLWNLKREVKHMMEEAVMKKCIHEENCSVTTLCAAVEACLLHGLKRRAVGIFKTSTTMALLQKISRHCSPAGEVIRQVNFEQRSNESSGNLFSFSKKMSTIEENQNKANHSAVCKRYAWIRTALMDHSLYKIVEHIVNNSGKYYELYALVSNCVDGPILVSLLAGPCALEFTRIKSSDYFWTDPHAGELVQRHRMHSSNRNMVSINHSDSPKLRPRLQINLKRHASSSSEEAQRVLSIATNIPKEYVESLHQNAKSQLIYGKNNVLVQPISGHDAIPGYLSLHNNHFGLTLKWTPNQLMNGSVNDLDQSNNTESTKRFSVYWDYAISVSLSSIVYLHCHQHVDGDRIVLVGRDGVQYPPLHIKDKGGHLLSFLSCLESGLAPYGQLDPPLGFEREQGKTLPKLQRRNEINLEDDNDSLISSPATADYVFRIVLFSDLREETTSSQSSLSPPIPTHLNSISLPNSPIDGAFTDSAVYVAPVISLHKSISVRTSMASLCDTMRRQILSRAFYGWLAYCRHLKTVRIHLASLVYPIVNENPTKLSYSQKLSHEIWQDFLSNKTIDSQDIFQQIYSAGCDPSIRKEVWPFLFSHYPFESTNDERNEIDRVLRENYSKTVEQWRRAEEIIQKLDVLRLNSRKLTAESSDSTASPTKNISGQNSSKTLEHIQRKDSIISNDVFYEDSSIQSIMLTNEQVVIDRSSPFNIIETIDGQNLPTRSRSSSTASTQDVYVDAVDKFDEERAETFNSSNIYETFTQETIEMFANNIHRIDKDVARCDRNYPYFMNNENLNKLRNIMCTYVWENLQTGYIQGMCDLVAPFLVIFDEETMSYSCFCSLMKRLLPNFPQGTGMDDNFNHMRSLLQILDSELYEHIHRTGDFTHFYFCYRWFLLDFKREFVYDDVFLLWEVIASAQRTVSKRFSLFIALSMMKSYREIILDHRMDFTDIIKFFNEMAERHDAQDVLRSARELIVDLQKLIDNK